MEEERVVLVDASDHEIGTAPKLSAHQEGTLHRAFSVFVFNSRDELLLQRRAEEKYHSGGLWSNTCCSHPRPGEEVTAAAKRRLSEEMGLEIELEPVFRFTYRAALGNGLVEHELDHVYVGRTDRDPHPDYAEVAEWRWAPAALLCAEIEQNPAAFTAWFREPFEELLSRRKGEP